MNDVHIYGHMYLSSRAVVHEDSMKRTVQYDLHLLRCDTCGKEWETRGSGTRLQSRKTHACSNECKRASHRAGGAVAMITGATNIQRYGVENVYAAPVVKEKIRQRHLERRGVDHPSKDSTVRKRAEESTLRNHGVRFAQQSPAVREKARQTMLKHWGVEHPMQLEHVQRALEAGCMAKYGVKRALQLPAMFQKVHDARKASGAYARQSKAENAFHAALVERFGTDDVERWILVNEHWPIDFWVKSIDAYVQFDGVYWHGLDRPIEQIRSSPKPRDKAIAGKWDLDRQQEAWFMQQGLRLVRVTDAEFRRDVTACIERVKAG
jgi:hypothetical protein